MPEIDDLSSLLASSMGGGEAMPEMAGLPQGQPEEIAAPYVQEGGESPADHRRLLDWIEHPNIAEELDEDTLRKIGMRVHRELQIDDDTRSDWVMQSEEAMDLAMQVAKGKTFPWPNASNIVFPLMTTAAVQFQARAFPAIIQGRNVVKGIVIGRDNGIPQIGPDGSPVVQMTPQGPQPQWAQPPGAKKDRAERIGEHMSWQLLEEMKEWQEETDKLLLILPIIGCVFRKTYFRKDWHTNVSSLVMPINLVVNFWAPALERAPRISEELKLYPNEIEENIRGGLFIDQDYPQNGSDGEDEDAPREFIEQHRLWDLDEDGYAEPYVVTVHKSSQKVARIVARYDGDGVHIDQSKGNKIARIEPIHYYTKFDFLPNPRGGIYGVGFGQLLGPINKAVNTSLNQLFDAGTLQNTGGGFIGRGLSMASGAIKFKLGEWKVVNAPGQSIRDSVVPMQHAGPSPVLFQLLGLLIDSGKEVASVKDALTGETAAATMQPTTLMALIEQGLKVFTAIFKRVHGSAKKEYDKLYDLNRRYLEIQQRYQVGDEWKVITKEDYARGAGVKPISDPAMVSDAQKAAKVQFLLSPPFIGNPLINQMEILQRALDVAGETDIEKLIVQQPPQNPELIAKAAEMELEGKKTEAEIENMKFERLEKITSAILNLAKADATVGDQHMSWIEQHIDILRMNMEALQQPARKEGQADPGGLPMGPDGTPQTNHPGLPSSPHDLMMPNANAGAEEPPFPDARQDRNGSWYPGHPARPVPAGGF